MAGREKHARRCSGQTGLRVGFVGLAAAESIGVQRLRVDAGEVVAAEVADPQFAEHVVEDRGLAEQIVPRRSSTSPGSSNRVKTKGFDEFLQRHAVCSPIETAMAKLFISERKAAPSLCISRKISTELAVFVFAPVCR